MLKWIIGGFVVLALIGAVAGGSGEEKVAPQKADATEPAPAVDTTPKPEPKPKKVKVPDVVGMGHQEAQDIMQANGLYNLVEKDCSGQDRMLLLDRNWRVEKQTPVAGRKVGENHSVTLCSVKKADSAPAQEAPVEPAAPATSAGQENAVATAQDYLDYSGFSASGLTEQLTYEGYSQADAEYAVANVDVDWNAEAVESAKDYLDYSSFSAQGLLEQLTYDGFTPEQAQQAVDSAY